VVKVLNCDKCGERAVYSRRYSGQRFCEEHFLSYFEAKVRRTLLSGGMLKRGDIVAVGLSGGKDSLTTLYLLDKMREQLVLDLHAIAVDEGIKAYRGKTLAAAEAFCSTRKIPLSIVSIEERYGFTLDDAAKVGKNQACTYCGVFRRKLLNEKALELGADKLATGHNLDDEAQVIMMNYVSGDVARVARYASEAMVRGFVRRIKPLGEMPEKEVALYALLRDLGASFWGELRGVPVCRGFPEVKN
jgi:tRNA(Ile)-lysidine synthase TilS/MesJ